MSEWCLRLVRTCARARENETQTDRAPPRAGPTRRLRLRGWGACPRVRVRARGGGLSHASATKPCSPVATDGSEYPSRACACAGGAVASPTPRRVSSLA
jgi:hypothetical protein